MTRPALLITLLLLLLPGSAPAAASTVRPSIQVVTAPEVKEMLGHGAALLINVLSHLEFENQHIPGSINIPIVALDTTDQLPADKNRPLIFYCMGKRCPYSERAAQFALEKGYTRVYLFAGGIPEWRYFNYPMEATASWRDIAVPKLTPQETLTLLQRESVITLDVRPLEYAANSSFIHGAVLLPLVYLETHYQELDKSCPLLLSDWAMKQSPIAAKFLISKGFTVRGVLKGGIERWNKEQLPVESRPPGMKNFTTTWQGEPPTCR